MTMNCDLETGTCSVPELDNDQKAVNNDESDISLVYIGDPMCSWCWGASKTIKQAREYAIQNGIGFSVITGGLRPGGGDAWTEDFKNFLRREWRNIENITQQPFTEKLLEREHFNYDTEPPARAVHIARYLWQGKDLNDEKLLSFFSAIQYKFYVDGEDPNEIEFYRSICEKFEIDFDLFAKNFSSSEMQKATYEEFQLNRSWGVRGFPSFAIRKGNNVEVIGSGSLTLDKLTKAIDETVKQDFKA
ncbi:hypothetical protein G9F32_15625 [Acinetobacter sp. 194]|uniref:DsbA family protein n=1 Tax=Acinetobacter shaoyimingii TaxID=2715164 RepID=UPI00140AD0AA|nr:DsbA family protein [Acinetobacter shaoyimingii]NHB59428.1 hypothetical protein [Acinetobacter shaoyimingii]